MQPFCCSFDGRRQRLQVRRGVVLQAGRPCLLRIQMLSSFSSIPFNPPCRTPAHSKESRKLTATLCSAWSGASGRVCMLLPGRRKRPTGRSINWKSSPRKRAIRSSRTSTNPHGFALFAQGDLANAADELATDAHNPLVLRQLILAQEKLGNSSGAEASRARLKFLRASSVEWYLVARPTSGNAD